jgi:hypothetical protein
MGVRSVARNWFRAASSEAPVLQESPGVPVAVCECEAWHGFMVEVLFPRATRISVAPGERATSVVDKIPSSARALLMHFNATVTHGFIDGEGELRQALDKRGLPALNFRAFDIRKSTLQARCRELGLTSLTAGREGPGEERLIVKTTLNFGGQPERNLRDRWGDRAAAFTADISETIRSHRGYVVTTRAEVPASIWADPTLVVERFVENPEGFFLRVYLAGPAGVASVVWIDGDVKKLSVGIRRRLNYFFWTPASGATVPVGPVNDRALRALEDVRRVGDAMGIDFLGADCVVDAEDRIAIVDVNKTPYWGVPRESPILSHLRHGFNALVGDFT